MSIGSSQQSMPPAPQVAPAPAPDAGTARPAATAALSPEPGASSPEPGARPASASATAATAGGAVTVVRAPGALERDRSRYQRRQRVVDMALRFGTPIVLLLLWQWASTSGAIDRQFWPPPTEVASAFGDSVSSGYLGENLWKTFVRLIYGYAGGAAAGILLGLLLGTVRALRVALEPIVSALYTVPKLAIFPLLLLVFGVGDAPKIILTGLGAFFVTCLSTLAAVVSVPAPMHEPMRSFQASWLQTFRHLTVPAVLPEVFHALRLGAGMAVLVLVGMEMIQGANGLGAMIWSSWQVFDTGRMYVGIVVAAVFGVLFQSAIKWAGTLLLPWTRNDR
ncbi:ABC transporter permease [Frankia sp. CcI49]|uniref:ABC transporter permease n=1 Tax=Frankia sp. CcI49 TaxID=1745382 RepID=UPI000A04264D|nr:ABC transporter permease [Frankia sp. CcI49]